MQLRDQSQALGRLPADLRAKAENEASINLTRRLRTGLPVYPFVLAIFWTGTDYGTTQLGVLVIVSLLFGVGIGLRAYAISERDKLFARSPEGWYRWVCATVLLLAGSFGFMFAHAMVIYGFEKWGFIVILMWNTGVVAGSIVSFAPSPLLLRIQIASLLLPSLTVAFWLHGSLAMQYALGNVALMLFSFSQGRQIGNDFHEQLADQFMEDQRRAETEAARHTAETALVVAEEARRKAEQAAKARSEFLANMSHEIRTPMNAVMGMTTLILDQELPAETLDCVNAIRSSSEALLTIINDILDFSKIESGKLDLEQEPFSLYDCLEEVLELLGSRASQKGIELTASLEPQVSEWIVGDVTRTRQILLNLVGNAVKFTAQGEVAVTGNVRTAENGTQTLHLAVRDTGIGVPADKIGLLFHSFSQVDSSTTRRFGGTGLGLAISKRLTELMGGRVWVTSESGVGSVFQFEIPYRTAGAQKLKLAAGRDWPGKRIIVVDDNETSRQILISQLARWKFAVRGAASAQEAWSALLIESADLILVDGQMPEMSGSDLAAAVQREFGPSAPPIILLSTGNLSGKEVVAGILPKPVRRHQLHRTIGQVLSGERESRAVDKKKILDGDFGKRVPLRILLAEDNPVNQIVAVGMLERLGYRPDAVSNGLEVLEAVRRQTYDVVLMDVQMPEMNGLDATREILADFKDERPWIMAVTAGAMKENRDDCIAAGVDDFLTKPISVQELKAGLERCFKAKKMALRQRRTALEEETVAV